MSFFITLVENSDSSRRAIRETSLPKVHAMIREAKGLTLPEYQAFLRDLYHIVLAFLPDHGNRRGTLRRRPAQRIRYELYERIGEEKGHEDWVLEDIVAVGGDANARAAAPSAPVQAMIGFNYYAAERVHPCSVLGMLYVLEVVASVYGGKVADSIARAIGRDTAAGGFRFLSSHATMDADHMAQLNVLLKTIDDPAAQSRDHRFDARQASTSSASSFPRAVSLRTSCAEGGTQPAAIATPGAGTASAASAAAVAASMRSIWARTTRGSSCAYRGLPAAWRNPPRYRRSRPARRG